MSFIDERNALTREKRLSTLSHYNGHLAELKDEINGTEIHQKIRTFSQAGYDEIIVAEKIISDIDNAVMIIHGAAGCAAAPAAFNKIHPVSWYTTGLNEKDTILGGDEKLERTVLKAFDEQSPDVIFIIGTPVVAINNDDVASVIMELQDEIGIPIIHLSTDGFRSKTPFTGYDTFSHAILKYLIYRPGEENTEKENFLNVISLTENRKNVDAVLEILSDLGIEYNLFPQFGNVENIRRASKAAASIVLDRDEGAYLASELEEVFGVKYIHMLPPIGFHRVSTFIKKTASVFHKEKEASEYMAEKTSQIEHKSHNLFLEGKEVFIDTEADKAVGLSEFVQDAGGTVAAIALTDIDIENRKYLDKIASANPSATVIVGNGQIFEKANELSKHPVDYYISTETSPAFADKYGTVPVDLTDALYYGYSGVRCLVEKILSSEKFPYSDETELYAGSWLRKSGNWYVKQEVK